MRIHAHDSLKRLFTKKIRSISALDAAEGVHTLLFRPTSGRTFFIKEVYTKVRSAIGTNTEAANITIDNGTNGQDIVAAVDLGTATAAVKRHTMASTTRLVDHDNPLRLTVNDGAAGNTEFLVDVLVEMVELTDGPE